MRVDRGIDREETAVAAVSERYRGDNVLGVETSPTGGFVDVAPSMKFSCDVRLLNKDTKYITCSCYVFYKSFYVPIVH